MKRANLDVLLFQCKVTVLSLSLCESSEHLQNTLLTKLLGQFIEVHNTQFFKRL